jgi:hypothetical protein
VSKKIFELRFFDKMLKIFYKTPTIIIIAKLSVTWFRNIKRIVLWSNSVSFF